MTLKFLVCSAMITAAAFADSSAKGIFVSGGNDNSGGGEATPAVKYSLELRRNGETRPASVSQRFQDGDRFRFKFQLNRPGYVYLVNRTMKGDPDTLERYVGAKGIDVVSGDESAASYTLLYPREDAGTANKLTPERPHAVPESNFFEMDAHPGIEKLVLVVSPKPIDISKYFSVTTGQARRQNRNSHNDSNNDVMGQLAKDLADNANTEDSTTDSKGICVGDCDSYAAPRQTGKPMMISIDLRHYPGRNDR